MQESNIQDGAALKILRPFWVRVMADYSSTGLWDSRGANVEESFVPMSDALRARFTAWCQWYEKNDDYRPAPVGQFDYMAFSAEGLSIAKAIKAELPHWTVVYFDEAKMPGVSGNQREPRSAYEYEITPEVLRKT